MCRAAASHPDTPLTAVVADAARLPFPDNAADRVVAFMALHDIDDLPGTVGEIARVLGSGGVLVLAIVHPLNSALKYDGELDAHVMRRSWYEERRVSGTFNRAGLTMTFHSRHRPLQAYTETLAGAGFVIDRLCEPTSEGHRIPWFLHIRAVLAVD
jgi:SAM-dependent methyltransferase